jgi:FAD/FMN-containing dehydrogenase
VRRAFDETAAYATGGTYVNALAEGQSITDAYSAGILARLVEVKRQYDPDGVFSANGIA